MASIKIKISENTLATHAPITSAYTIFKFIGVTTLITNAGNRCKSATSELAKSSAESMFLTPILSKVAIKFILAATNSDGS